MTSSSALSKSLSLLLAGVLFFLFQACVHAPQKKGPTCQADPEIYRRALLTLSRNYVSLSGKVKVRIETSQGNVSFTGDLYAKAPDKLHLDVFGFLHRPRFVLIKNGETIAWKDFDSGRSYMGLLERCPGFPVKFPFSPLFLRDFMRILFLNFPGSLKILPGGDAETPCAFQMVCGWGVFDAIMDPRVGLPVFLKGPKGEKEIFEITFSDYSEVSSLQVPWRYGVDVKDVKMTFEFKTLDVNQEIPRKIFIPLLPK